MIPPYMMAMCCLSTAIVVYIIVRQRNRIKQLNRMQAVRQRIAADLHDDIGSTLTSITMLSKSSPNQGHDQTTETFETIAGASSQASTLLSDIVWSVNPDNDKFANVMSRMREYAASALEPAGINLKITSDDEGDDLQLPMDKRKDVYLIFKEAVNNAAKYSGATTVNISVSCTSSLFSMEIADNGNGFSELHGEGGNGLANMKRRSDALRGTLTITSNANTGTNISLKVPLYKRGISGAL